MPARAGHWSTRVGYTAPLAGHFAGCRASACHHTSTAVSAYQRRVQRQIRIGLGEGARLIAGGEGRPDGVDAGWSCVRPSSAMCATTWSLRARKIFGPVLSIIAYRDTEDAIAIANDTPYGLQAYVCSADAKRASAVALRIEAERVLVNTLAHEPAAPFGGFKQSGIGREYGTFGLEAFLEPKALLGTT
jgi:aldehyde dehydrogenase (NAD+)